MQLTINIDNPKDAAKKLREHAELFDGLNGATKGPTKKKASAKDPEETDEDEDEDEDELPTTKKAASAPDDDDDEEETDDDDDQDSDDDEKPAKKAKAKKITANDVLEACKTRAKRTGGKKGREEVLTILRKKFDVETVSELDETDYAKALKYLEA